MTPALSISHLRKVYRRGTVAVEDISLSIPEEGEIYDMLRFLSLVEPIFVHPRATRPVRAEVPPADSQFTETPFDDANLQIVFTAHPLDFEQTGWAGAHIVGREPDA